MLNHHNNNMEFLNNYIHYLWRIVFYMSLYISNILVPILELIHFYAQTLYEIHRLYNVKAP